MIIVIGSIVIKNGCLEEALTLSQQHVQRSRTEPGCISHGVHIDSENPNRLVFVEQWADQAALDQHFKVPASQEFVGALVNISVEGPEMSIYDAAELS